MTSLDQNLSDNFRMDSLERWLNGETDFFQTPLVEDGLMGTHEKCGWFYEEVSDEILFMPSASVVSARYFMNMDVWSRATFVRNMSPFGSYV
ncbi:hypothetical protein LX36DRAFT_661920 [Colletotrichum falcatum]|nr:hypothetical protein LX36DRAFT_661920 [Colletotrichum falcatum]